MEESPENTAATEVIDSKLDPCPICWRPYHTSTGDESSEEPTITACGHIFGRDCIAKWLQGNAHSPTCPCCRYQLQFSECGHAIAAVKLYETDTAPTKLRAGEKLDESGKTMKDDNHPKMCIECYLCSVESGDMVKTREEYLVRVKESGEWYEAVPELPQQVITAPASVPASAPPRVTLRYRAMPTGATRLANAPFLNFGDEPIEVVETDMDDDMDDNMNDNMLMLGDIDGEETDDETEDDTDEEMGAEIIEVEYN